jgi:alpha-beta hydrolase superfamily lysophospholipase
MIHFEGSLSSKDGTNLFYQSWKPEQDCQAIIAIVHGGGEHSGRYNNVVSYFIEKDYSLYGFDFRGHGKSAGKIGHVMDWGELRDDLNSYLQLIRDENPEKPLFIYSHSMGAQIALDYLTLSGYIQPTGIIASSPALAQPAVSALLISVSKALALIWPAFSLQTGLDINAISRDAEVVRAYRDDPLVSSMVSARFGAEFMACIDRVHANADKLNVPLFMFQGEADQIVPVAGTRQFFEKVSFTDKKLKMYKDGFHEPHNDFDQLKVFQDVEQWFIDHMPAMK